MEIFNGYFALSQYCIDSDIQTPVCNGFWTMVCAVCFASAFILITLMGRSLFAEYWEFRKNRLRLEARKVVALPEAIAACRWHGEDNVVEGTQDEIAGKIRAAINSLHDAKNKSVP